MKQHSTTSLAADDELNNFLCRTPFYVIMQKLQLQTFNKSSAVAEMAARCCTSRIVKRWDMSVLRENHTSAVVSDNAEN